MNAVIALCHFCEAHGPVPVFCTQTLRDTKIEELNFSKQTVNGNCSACNSIGSTIGMLSKDDESNANFLSTQVAVIADVIQLLRQAAVRSLSCEVSSNKNGGFVFFGDASRGHVLSHTFQIRDAQARGFYRLFSIIILMKDKLFLLNVQPFLAENLENISKELQTYSTAVYDQEQGKFSERAQRINSGLPNTQPPRSLAVLTGEDHIYAVIHSHFAWLLWAGARYLTETITLGSPTVPPWVGNETEEGFAMVQIDKEDWLMRKLGLQPEEELELGPYALRNYKEQLRSDFLPLCYCAIVGIQVSSQASYLLILSLLHGILLFFVDNFKRTSKFNV